MFRYKNLYQNAKTRQLQRQDSSSHQTYILSLLHSFADKFLPSFTTDTNNTINVINIRADTFHYFRNQSSNTNQLVESVSKNLTNRHSLAPPSDPLSQRHRFNFCFLALYKFIYLPTYLSVTDSIKKSILGPSLLSVKSIIHLLGRWKQSVRL